MAEDNNELLKQIEQKYRDLGENPTTYLEGQIGRAHV